MFHFTCHYTLSICKRGEDNLSFLVPNSGINRHFYSLWSGRHIIIPCKAEQGQLLNCANPKLKLVIVLRSLSFWIPWLLLWHLFLQDRQSCRWRAGAHSSKPCSWPQALTVLHSTPAGRSCGASWNLNMPEAHLLASWIHVTTASGINNQIRYL